MLCFICAHLLLCLWCVFVCVGKVYIYGCVDATIDIKGKCKMVAIDGCKKTKVRIALQDWLPIPAVIRS